MKQNTGLHLAHTPHPDSFSLAHPLDDLPLEHSVILHPCPQLSPWNQTPPHCQAPQLQPPSQHRLEHQRITLHTYRSCQARPPHPGFHDPKSSLSKTFIAPTPKALWTTKQPSKNKGLYPGQLAPSYSNINRTVSTDINHIGDSKHSAHSNIQVTPHPHDSHRETPHPHVPYLDAPPSLSNPQMIRLRKHHPSKGTKETLSLTSRADLKTQLQELFDSSETELEAQGMTRTADQLLHETQMHTAGETYDFAFPSRSNPQQSSEHQLPLSRDQSHRQPRKQNHGPSHYPRPEHYHTHIEHHCTYHQHHRTRHEHRHSHPEHSRLNGSVSLESQTAHDTPLVLNLPYYEFAFAGRSANSPSHQSHSSLQRFLKIRQKLRRRNSAIVEQIKQETHPGLKLAQSPTKCSYDMAASQSVSARPCLHETQSPMPEWLSKKRNHNISIAQRQRARQRIKFKGKDIVDREISLFKDFEHFANVKPICDRLTNSPSKAIKSPSQRRNRKYSQEDSLRSHPSQLGHPLSPDHPLSLGHPPSPDHHTLHGKKSCFQMFNMAIIPMTFDSEAPERSHPSRSSFSLGASKNKACVRQSRVSTLRNSNPEVKSSLEDASEAGQTRVSRPRSRDTGLNNAN